MFLTAIMAATPENPKFSLHDPDAWDKLNMGPPASSGVKVSRDTALTYAPWWRGVNLISSDVAKLPVHVYSVKNESKALDRTHPAWRLLRRKPNEYQTAFTFKQKLTADAIQTGNGYAYIDRDGAGRPSALLPLDPGDVIPVREDGVLWYVVKVKGEQRKIPASDMLHLKGFSPDGLVGYSVYDKARESIGLGLGARKYGSVFLKNNARPNVALEVPRTLTEPQQKALADGWNAIQGGLDNAHKVAILQGGAKLHTFSINAREAQLLETRQFEIREIALYLNLPPHKLGDSSKASYNSLEQENQDYLDSGLDPWLVRWEEECWDKLLTEEEKADESREVLFNRKALVRANLTDRGNYYRTATGGRPWMVPDEVRQEEDMEPMGGEASELKDPLNMAKEPPANDSASPPSKRKPGKQQPAPPDDEDETKASVTPAAVRVVVEDATRRMAKRLGHAARAAAKKPAEFARWLDTFHGDHWDVVLEAFTPAAGLVDRTAVHMAEQILAEVRRDLLDVSGQCKPADLAARVDGRMLTLEQTLPAELARLFTEKDK